MKDFYYLAFVPCDNVLAIFSPDFPEVASQGHDIEDCMRMGMDALKICFEEYARTGRDLPAPSNLTEAKQKMKAYLRELDFSVADDSITWQLFAGPQTENAPIRISVSISKATLAAIDRKASGLGMSRSRFLTTAAMAYAG